MRSMTKRLTSLSSFAILVACGGGQEPPAPPPPAVEVQKIGLQSVAAEFEFVARTRAKEDTDIRARITGTIIERNFAEGQLVEEDALLYKIDPRPYRAALNSARAELSQVDAALAVASRNLKRGEELEPDGFISDAEMDQLRGDHERAVASREAAEATIDSAQINLEFTEIRAPFSGTAGRSQFSIGDLVSPSTGALVTLVQRDPMLVDFDVTERALALRIKENQERQAQGLPPDVYTPRLRLVTGDDYAYDGVIDYTSNRVNASTGTISVTTSFPNPDNTLIPGQFARIVVRRGQPEMQLLVPQPSVLEDMQGRYVYIVADDETVARRNVELGQREGVDWVVMTGLEEGDRVIVNGIQKVRPGMPVTASPVGAQPHHESAGAE